LEKGGKEASEADGCLVRQCGHRTDEDAAKAGGRHKADRAKTRVWRREAALARKVVGEVCFLDKTFLWVSREMHSDVV
jgi:hypothetical protein